MPLPATVILSLLAGSRTSAYPSALGKKPTGLTYQYDASPLKELRLAQDGHWYCIIMVEAGFSVTFPRRIMYAQTSVIEQGL